MGHKASRRRWKAGGYRADKWASEGAVKSGRKAPFISL